MKKLLIFIAFIFGIIFQGCNNPAENDLFNAPDENVIFKLPEWPPCDDFSKNYPELAFWEISVSASHEGVYHTEKFILKSNSTNFNLVLPKNKIAVVSANPITKISDDATTSFFHQAGTVYPGLAAWDGKNCTNTLTWQDGFTAKIAESVPLAFAEHFNWKKFSGTINSNQKKSESLFYNPWHLDIKNIIQRMIAKTFTAATLNPKNVIDLPIKNISPLNQTEIEPAILSSYIPENQFIYETGCVGAKKTSKNSFFYTKEKIALVKITSTTPEKKGSAEIIFMPKLVGDE